MTDNWYLNSESLVVEVVNGELVVEGRLFKWQIFVSGGGMNILIKSSCSNIISLNRVGPCLPRSCARSAKCCSKLGFFKPLSLSKFWFMLHIFKHIK